MTTYRLAGTLADYRITSALLGRKTYITTVKPGGAFQGIAEGDTVQFLGDLSDWKFTNGALLRADGGPGAAPAPGVDTAAIRTEVGTARAALDRIERALAQG